MNRLKLILCAVLLVLGVQQGFAVKPQSGQFQKSAWYNGPITIVDVREDVGVARMVATAFEGLVNRDTAQCYLLLNRYHERQFNDTGRPSRKLVREAGPIGGLESMFKEYSGRVKTIYIWSPEEDWSWDMAVMLSAQNDGLPLTEDLYRHIAVKNGWQGNVERLYCRWNTRNEAYEWAMKELQPKCHKSILFSLGLRKDWVGNPWTLYDYAVATKGFTFWLDDADPKYAATIEKICANGNFQPGSVVMGYAQSGDDLLYITNRYNIGYVVSDFYANASFWNSYPSKAFKQRKGKAVKAQAGKIYVSVVFSDGDNLQFDQNALYDIWTEDTERGKFPVGTTLCAGLQELNPFLIDWYYSHATSNDELLGGPSGYQFIYGRDYNDEGYGKWLELNRAWLASAGFKTACFWHTSYATDHFDRYIATCGLEGIFTGDDDMVLDVVGDVVIMNQGDHLVYEGDLYNNLAARAGRLSTDRPHFLNVYPTSETYGHNGIARLIREMERLDKDFPGRFVFLLPKDNVATARKYYARHPEHIYWKNKDK